LNSACSFGVLGNQAITSTGLTTIFGDVGIYPNGRTSVTGFGPAISNGTIHGADAIAQAALADARTAYNTCKSMTSTADLTGDDLGGMVITAGVYSFSSSVGITGTLTLDGQGNSNSLFVFQIGSTLITATAAVVKLINGARASNVFWQVGSSATFGTGTTFSGIVLAYTSITMNSNVAANGGMFALGAAVTMINDIVKVASSSCNNNRSCAASSTQAPSTHAPSTQAPSTAAPTEAPSTEAPSTNAPSTQAPSTHAPSTKAPSTQAPSTHAPSTKAPSTQAPSTHAPSTQAPSTAAPTETRSTKARSTEAPAKRSTSQKPEQYKSTDAVTHHSTS
jgi:type VI secretion system secreted protein VgrG